MRPDDTEKELERKVRLATIIGTFQATLTNFRYLRRRWKQNAENEALLGVSFTGIMDNPITYKDAHLGDLLDRMREYAVSVNKEWADKLGINQAAAISCVKPSGTVSQLVDCSSGIHPRYSPYYLRTVRADGKDPLAKFMIDKGFYWETDRMNNNNYVFYFPIKSPDYSVTGDDFTAIDQLNLWEKYHDHWCEHKPSMTVHYSDDEFLKVGQWVWDRFNKISGVAFLPRFDHVFPQAPYIPINKEKYEEWLEYMPKDVDWSELAYYEGDDYTEGSQELACKGGGCEI